MSWHKPTKHTVEIFIHVFYISPLIYYIFCILDVSAHKNKQLKNEIAEQYTVYKKGIQTMRQLHRWAEPRRRQSVTEAWRTHQRPGLIGRHFE